MAETHQKECSSYGTEPSTSGISLQTIQKFRIIDPDDSKPASSSPKTNVEIVQPLAQRADNKGLTPTLLDGLISERYSRVTCFDCAAGEMPTRYCYLTEGEKPPPVTSYHELKIDSQEDKNTVPSSYKNTWLNLPVLSKTKLYSYLKSLLPLHFEIVFDNRVNSWINKPSDYPVAASPQEIQYYGAFEEKHDVWKTLACGRSQEDMDKAVKDIEENFDFFVSLSDLWQIAFLRDMTNGAARAAIERTLEHVTTLARGLECCIPLYMFKSITSPTVEDSFSVIYSVSSDCELRSSSNSCTSPNVAERPMSLQGEGQPSKKLKQDPEATGRRQSLPKHNQVFVDCALISEDESTGTGKYIFLIEIFSHGKTLHRAEIEFAKKIVHVLQAQSQVFGLFFASSYVKIYRALKKPDQEIVVAYKTYKLKSFPELYGRSGYVNFPVAVFQEFWMDVFSSFIFGLGEIET